MGNSSIGQVSVDFVAEFSRFRDDMAKGAKVVAEHTSQMAAGFKTVEGAVKLVEAGLAAFGVGLGIKELVDFASRAIEAGAQLKGLAAQTGVSTDTLQVWQYAARLSGTSADAMTAGMEHLTRSIGEAASGNASAITSFKGLGVGVLDAKNNIRSTDDVLKQIARSVAAAKTPAEQARIAWEAFGKAGQQLIPTLAEMGRSSDDVAAKARDMFQVLSPQQIEALDKMDAEFQTLKTSVLNLAAAFLEQFGPAIESTINQIAKLMGAGGNGPLGNAFDDTNKLLEQTNGYIKGQQDLIKSLTQAWNPFGLISSSILREELQAEENINQALRIRAQLQSNLSEMGERQRDPSLKGGKPAADPNAGQHNPTAVGTGLSAAQKQAEAIKRVIDNLRAEYENLGLDSEAIKLNNALRQAGVTAASAQGQQIAGMVHQGEAYRDMLTEMNQEEADRDALMQQGRDLMVSLETPAEKHAADLAEIDKLYASGGLSIEKYNTALDRTNAAYEASDPKLQQAANQAKDFQNQVDQLAQGLGTDLARAFTDAGTAADRFRNLAVHVLQDVLNMVTSLLMKSASGGSGGGGLGDLFGGLLNGIVGSLFGGSAPLTSGGGTMPLGAGAMHLAGGGGFGAGQLALVGEEGPELVRFGSSGTVFPHRYSMSMLGGGGTVIHIDARGADLAAVARLERVVADLHRSIEPRSIAAVNGQRQRGGAFAASFRR